MLREAVIWAECGVRCFPYPGKRNNNAAIRNNSYDGTDGMLSFLQENYKSSVFADQIGCCRDLQKKQRSWPVGTGNSKKVKCAVTPYPGMGY
jgi:hypothetical protein